MARVSVDLHYRSPHHMLGDEGFSLVSNDYLANVLAKSVAASVVSLRRCAIMLYRSDGSRSRWSG
ncbi:hypothetical protein [Embleya sp. NPDC001921]